MAEVIKSNSTEKCDLKFHAVAKKYNRIEIFKYKKNSFKIYIDRNNSVYDIKNYKVISWKFVEGKRIPETVDNSRNVYLFNRIKGNPYKIACIKVMAELDALELVS